ncbi:DUF4440 domain-containing protein [Clostridium polynesiense]|uniref:DUF4440 domain-containing protein n=1 Tax=Clostridium polynesiense TaxID=1325933 RepID=UPI000AFBD27B|nr:DUF4440 domain-containing protein [Clostridium polynesiense]
MVDMDKHKLNIKRIYNPEFVLLKSEVRKSSSKLREIISDDFIEFTSSGTVYKYKKGDLFHSVDDNDELIWEVRDFTIKELENNCILAMYKLIKHNEQDESKKYSLRRFIWKNYTDKWKLGN